MVRKMRKVFRNHDNKAAFHCPGCGKSKLEDVTQYIGYDNRVKIRAKCQCGVNFSVFLERRQCSRKHTTLFGTYAGIGKGPQSAEQMMIVRDISCSGLRLARYSKNPLPFSHGDEFMVKLYLDDSFQRVARVRVKTCSNNGDYVGAELRSAEDGWNIEDYWRQEL